MKITVPEAAARTGLAAETIRRWIRTGRLPARKIGTQHLIEERDLRSVTARPRGGRVGDGAPAYETEPPQETIPLLQRVVHDARVLSGKPVVRGTRISVEVVLDCLAAGWTKAEILDGYPTLTEQDVHASAAYAAHRLRAERLYPLP